MKNLTLALASIMGIAISFLSFTHAAILQDAIQWGYENGLTSYNTSTSFRSYDTLRRDEAAKFLVVFAELQGTTANYSYDLNCDFRDIEKSRSDLKGYVNTACQLGILKGNNGYVLPQQNLTNAQIITTVVRILDGMQSEYGLTHRADNYYKRAIELGLDLSKFWNKDTATTRGDVMMLLYTAHRGGYNEGSYDGDYYYNGGSSNGSVDSVLQQIMNILEE